jgi:hypothetical protein
MKVLTATRNVLFVILFSLALAIALPASAFGQGRGHGRGRGPDLDKKCGKFVNCHDARDGRWDGRGPRRNVGVFRNGIFIPRQRRNRGIRERIVRNRINNDELFRARRFHRRSPE